MGGNRKKDQINWLPLVIYTCSFMRVIFRDFGYLIDSGIVLVADNECQARRFVAEFCQKTKGNGCKITSWNQRSSHPANYCCGFMLMQKRALEPQIISFMSQQGFLPVIVCGGIIPECLRSEQFFLRLKKQDLEEICDKDFASDVAEFREYITMNVPEVCRILEKHENSVLMTEYVGELSAKHIFAVLTAVGTVYASYLRTNQTEREVLDFFESYLQETKERLTQMSEFASGEELPEMLSSLVFDYLAEKQNVILTDEKRLSGKLCKLLKEEKIIFFDEKFYYFPPRLFMEICAPLLQTASEPELKSRLKRDGILYCNSADYTVKKEFLNIYGVKQRPRLLWINKEYIVSPENLCLEDVFPVYTEEELEYE